MSSPQPRPRLGEAAEATLVIAARAGDDGAYAELVRRREQWLRHLLRRLCRDPDEADDLAQEALLQGWRTLRALQAPQAFGAWLRRIAVNEYLQRMRRRAPQLVPAGDGSFEQELAAEPNDAARLDLEEALARLAPEPRLCIVLSYGERLSHAEISAATGLPLGTVKSHIARGAARLRALLKEYAHE